MGDNFKFQNLYDDTRSILDNGIGNDKLFIYSKDNYLFVIENDIRCFKVSFRRLRNIMSLKTNKEVKNILIENIKKIFLKKKNENLYLLNIYQSKKINNFYNCNYEIKLKEVNEFLNIQKNENFNAVIQKLYDKINILLKKITEYENKFKEPTTDEEIFIIY
jgi:hypothetical protein